MRKLLPISIPDSAFFTTVIEFQDNDFVNKTLVSLEKCVDFFHSINEKGRYTRNYKPELTTGFSGDILEENELEVGSPVNSMYGKLLF